ncbi:class I SAM-dependent methyltransferase [Nocardioides sp. T2.26MG-1]|uniref:class I SAM-dependent methyltransferase n=1 Tax=Nocardioides sp. T2.26MG-1 TaxID=3041166 RepID=UPI00254010E0|nr:class I SAM-dependent methyltransferase [Nocardioides sp. T2.26MG-1]
MTTDREDGRPASTTAVLVCQGRAAADGRHAPGRFADPVAVRLLREEERAVVEQVRAGQPPTGWSERSAYETVRACAEVMAPRTVAIDDAIRSHPARQLVILGAGLDDRAWRLAELGETVVWEVDHPASQQDKRDRSDGLPPLTQTIHFCPVDFARDDLATALEASGHDPTTPTTWLWEGVVPYLTTEQVRTTLELVARRSAPGSTLVLNYQSHSLRASVGRRLAGLVGAVGRGRSPLAREPWRTLLEPQQVTSMLNRAGFAIETDTDLLTEAARLGMAPRARTSLRTGRVAVATHSAS